MNPNDEAKPTAVAATPTQAGDTRAPGWWVERCVWTERLWSRLGSTEEQNRVWFSLMDKVYAPANKGRGRGRDHQTWTNRWFATQGLFSLENA